VVGCGLHGADHERPLGAVAGSRHGTR
jgi:hypothetical protein